MIETKHFKTILSAWICRWIWQFHLSQIIFFFPLCEVLLCYQKKHEEKYSTYIRELVLLLVVHCPLLISYFHFRIWLKCLITKILSIELAFPKHRQALIQSTDDFPQDQLSLNIGNSQNHSIILHFFVN